MERVVEARRTSMGKSQGGGRLVRGKRGKKARGSRGGQTGEDRPMEVVFDVGDEDTAGDLVVGSPDR